MLTTERLVLHPWTADDAPELHATFTDPLVRRYLLDDEVVSRNWVEAEIRASVDRFADGGAGLWAIRAGPGQAPPPSAGTGAILGFAGFRPFFEPPEMQLLYGLHPSAWGRGFATEASRAVLGYAFDELGFVDVRAATDAPNTASVAVLERLGFSESRRTSEGMAGTIFFRLPAPRSRRD